MKNLRYINLGLIEPRFIMAVWEYSNLFTPDIPTLFSYIPNKLTIKMSGSIDMNDLVRVDNLPKDINMLRIISNNNSSFILDENLLVFHFHYPDINEYKSLIKAISAIVYTELKEIPLVTENNDIYFIKEEMRKKFFGMMDKNTSIGWKVSMFSLTFDFNSEFANSIYRFDNNKFRKKGLIKDISTIVGGLHEVSKELDKDKIAKGIVNKIANRYDFDLLNDSLSKLELEKMYKFVDDFDNKEWYLHGK